MMVKFEAAARLVKNRGVDRKERMGRIVGRVDNTWPLERHWQAFTYYNNRDLDS